MKTGNNHRLITVSLTKDRDTEQLRVDRQKIKKAYRGEIHQKLNETTFF